MMRKMNKMKMMKDFGLHDRKIGKREAINNKMTFKPWLPEEWEELQYKLKWRGDDLKVSIRSNEGVFTLLSDDQKTEEIVVFDKSFHLESGKETTIPF